MSDPKRLLNFRHHDKSCANCRYFRLHTTGASTSECLMLGQTLGIYPAGQLAELNTAAAVTLCDAWAKLPKGWQIHSIGVDSSPYWHDPYIPRAMAARIRRRRWGSA